jgi:heme/copper-type cytochrome/quinol oxidase subunit 1
MLIRTELEQPGNSIENYQIYNVTITAHAIIIIFFIFMPIIVGGYWKFD